MPLTPSSDSNSLSQSQPEMKTVETKVPKVCKCGKANNKVGSKYCGGCGMIVFKNVFYFS